jgi:tetratricopeptide (TPR) repeat protein
VLRALIAAAVLTVAPLAAGGQGPTGFQNDTIDPPAARDSAQRLDAAAVRLARFGSYREALALWQQAIQVAPNDFNAHFNSGMMFEVTRQAQAGLREFQLAYAMHPMTQLLYHLGVSFHNVGMRDSALTWFVAATDAQPRDVMSWGYAGFTAAELGRDSLALTYWRRALELQPRYFDLAEPQQRPLYERCLREATAATRSP